MSNYRTTMAGLVLLVFAFAVYNMKHLSENKDAIMTAGIAATAGIGLILAKDGNKRG